MRVLAVDQSYTNAGFAVVEKDDAGAIRIIDLPVLTFPKKATKQEKRNLLLPFICNIINLHSCDTLILERVRLFAHGKLSLKTYSTLHALNVAISDGVSLPCFAIDTRQWKTHVLGNPSATKEDAVLFVSREMGGLIVSHDTADAVCMAYATLNGAHLVSIE